MTPKPWISGFCGHDMPEDSHQRCLGSYDGRPCKCPHHAAERLLAHVHGIHVSADATLTFPLEGIGWEDTVRIANEVKAAHLALSAAAEFLAKHVAGQWPGRWKENQAVEGVGLVHPYRSSNTKWENDDVVEDLIDARMEAAGGEIPDPMTVARWITEAAHIDYWRVGKLESLELDANDYRHTTYGALRLSIKNDKHMVGDTTRDEAS